MWLPRGLGRNLSGFSGIRMTVVASRGLTLLGAVIMVAVLVIITGLFICHTIQWRGHVVEN